MIQTRCIRELSLQSGSGSRRADHVSAASGLVVAGEFLYVVADDEHHLAVFRVGDTRRGELLRLFPGELPANRKARKAHKPDLEVLTRLPPFADHPSGALLALASGSRANRRKGALLALDNTGAIAAAPCPIDLTAAYVALEQHAPGLNVEGAVISNGELILLQRGSLKHPANALIRLKLSSVLDAITASASLGSATGVVVQPVALGGVEGIPLSFTDAAVLPDGRIIFAAAAENTADNYLDGPCVGAAIGILSCDGRLDRMEAVQPTHKIEGIHAWIDGNDIKLLLVTDADDETVSSRLLAADWPL